MLPTTGFFKDIECPYNDSTCGRPYCHFMHRKRSIERPDEVPDQQAQSTEVPTYKPTPKSQLANTKSHIPISYVPDLVIRSDRSFRVPATYNYADKPTYKPTPLSELSKTSKASAGAASKEKSEVTIEGDATNHSSDVKSDPAATDGAGIDFEELSNEFNMIDEIINDQTSTDATNKEKEKQDGDASSKTHRPSSSKHEKSSSRRSGSKEKKDSKSSKSDSKSSRSESKSKSSNHKSRKSSSDSRDSKVSDKSTKLSHKHEHKKEHKSEKNSHKSEREKSHKDSNKSEKNNKPDDKSDKPKSDKHNSKSDKQNSKSDRRSSKSDKDKHKSDKDNHKLHRDGVKDEKKDKSRPKHDDKYDMHRSKSKSKHRDKEKHRSDTKKRDKSKSPEVIKKDRTPEWDDKYEQNDYTECTEVLERHISSEDEYEDMDETSLEEECYRIFNEYKPEPVQKPPGTETTPEVVQEYIPTPKKRIAYLSAELSNPKITHSKLKPAPNAALAMTHRLKLARIAHAKREEQWLMDEFTTSMKRPGQNLEDDVSVKVPKTNRTGDARRDSSDSVNGKGTSNQMAYKPTKHQIPLSTSSLEDILSGKSKLRIAPVQNVNSIQQAKAKLEEIARRKSNSASSKTPVQTLGKGTKRVAHVPDKSLADIPDVLQPDNKKIPVNIRTRYLTMIADECMKLYLVKEDAYERALNEEVKVLERCAALLTYRNSAMLAVNRIRKEVQEREAKGLGPISSGESHEDGGNSNFRGTKFYENIAGYMLTNEELELHGYPREGPIPGTAVVKTQKQTPRINLEENQRLCCRCFKVYLVDDHGIPLYEEECVYHPLKKRTLRGERIYLCCKSTEDFGCVTSNTHVSEVDDGADLEGFQVTMEPEREDDARNSAVYALDCEMCYTTKGLELTRVTIIDCDCKTIYETLVKPLNPIIDYNTRFSGITKDQMDRTSTSILQVQANILHLCNSKTILMGHSLESDLKALKIIHSSVIDTSVLFPHRLGLPHKRALRALASEYLRKIIQSDVGGHDSAEDALTCMELVMWKLKEDLKVRGVKS